jgi:hypothetical protein
MARDVKALESGMRKLQQSCAELGSQKYFDEFLQTIHRPGWTTVLDEFFGARRSRTCKTRCKTFRNTLKP